MGADQLTLGQRGPVLLHRLANVETVIAGGTGADTVTLGRGHRPTVRSTLGVGADKLTLGAFANTATVSNVETITGGSLADNVTLTTALTTAQSVDLGAGADKLTLANTANTATLANIETIVGGSGADNLTLSTALASGSIDLGVGSDSPDLRQRRPNSGDRRQCRSDRDRRNPGADTLLPRPPPSPPIRPSIWVPAPTS